MIHKGYATLSEPEKKLVEWDTITCCHCQKGIMVKPGEACTVYLIPTRKPGIFKEKAGAFCRLCMRPVCLRCDDDGRCTPWEKQIEAMEARGRLLRAVGV